jgi:hypothetical protein
MKWVALVRSGDATNPHLRVVAEEVTLDVALIVEPAVAALRDETS